MFKRPASSNQKLISKSAYAIALAVPFIGLYEETKASKIITSENQYIVENKLTESFQFNHQSNNNKFNLNLDNFLISEGENQNDENTTIEEKRVYLLPF